MDLLLTPVTISPELGVWDLALEQGDLVLDSTLATPMVVSLFSNARAKTHEVPPNTASLQGWWGNATLGSKLWTLARRKQTNETLNLATDMAKQALSELVNSPAVSELTVEASYRNNQLVLAMAVTQSDKTTQYHYTVN